MTFIIEFKEVLYFKLRSSHCYRCRRHQGPWGFLSNHLWLPLTDSHGRYQGSIICEGCHQTRHGTKTRTSVSMSYTSHERCLTGAREVTIHIPKSRRRCWELCAALWERQFWIGKIWNRLRRTVQSASRRGRVKRNLPI